MGDTQATSESETWQTHERWMDYALQLAQKAADEGEVPVGAVIVDSSGQLLGEAFNQREKAQNPVAHAEVLAIEKAASTIGSWRLIDTTLYVTLEPCPMCAGALVNARVGHLVFGCTDPKAGAVRSLYQLCDDSRLNHRMTITSGVRESACSAVLSAFFAKLRMR